MGEYYDKDKFTGSRPGGPAGGPMPPPPPPAALPDAAEKIWQLRLVQLACDYYLLLPGDLAPGAGAAVL